MQHIPESLAVHPFTCGLYQRQFGPRAQPRWYQGVSSNFQAAGEVRGRILLGVSVTEAAASPGGVARWRLHNGPDSTYPAIAHGWLAPESSSYYNLFGIDAPDGLFIAILAGTIDMTIYMMHDSLREEIIDIQHASNRSDYRRGAQVGD